MNNHSLAYVLYHNVFRILMFKKAKDFMKKIGASFIFTGEIQEQRPMSQHKHALRLIEKEAGLVVRPLSAKLLPPTIPELKGWVKREQFLPVREKSRKEQISLAKRFNIKDYPCPAGGRLLKDPNFAKRLKDLLRYSPDFTLNDIELIKSGRYFRLSPSTMMVIGRNKEENERFLQLVKGEDTYLYVDGYKGSVAILRREIRKQLVILAAQILAWYSEAPKTENLKVVCKLGENSSLINVKPAEMSIIEKFLV